MTDRTLDEDEARDIVEHRQAARLGGSRRQTGRVPDLDARAPSAGKPSVAKPPAAKPPAARSSATRPSQQRLGRGLAALIGEMEAIPREREEPALRPDRRVAIASIRANPNNPRREFDAAELDDLAASLRSHGLVQPIVVRSAPDGNGYEIIAGERRWRAAQLAELDDVPVVLREVSDTEALEIAIVENVQRADLNPIDEAMGYRQLVERYSYSQSDLSRVIGKSRSHVANTMRLLKLPDTVQTMVSAGQLTSGHARALVTSDDPLPIARRIVGEGLSVRAVERLAATPPRKPKPRAKPDDGSGSEADRAALEKTLSDALGLKVRLDVRGAKGTVRIDYGSLEQLEAVCAKLLGPLKG